MQAYVETQYIEIITAAMPADRVVVHNDGSQERKYVRNDHLYTRHVLSESDVREIGQLTRENVRTWMESHKGVDWFDILCWGPIHDFHAVCGDTDIPWHAEESKRLFQRVWLKEKQ